MAAPLTASPATPRTLSEAAAGLGSGTYPGSTTYPDGDIGRTQIGSVNDGDYAGFKTASQFTPSHAGTLTSISIYLTVIGTPTARVMVYADSAGAPGALLAASGDVVLTAGARKMVTFSGLSLAVVAGTPLWLAFGVDSSTCQVWCEPFGTGAHVYRGVPGATNPFGVPTASLSAGDNSISAFIGVVDLLSVPGRGGDLSATADVPGDGFIPEAIPFFITAGYGSLQAVPA